MSLWEFEARPTYMFRNVLSQDTREFGQWIQDQSRFFAHSSQSDRSQLEHDDVLCIINGNTKHSNKIYDIGHDCAHQYSIRYYNIIIGPTGKFNDVRDPSVRPPIAVWGRRAVAPKRCVALTRTRREVNNDKQTDWVITSYHEHENADSR